MKLLTSNIVKKLTFDFAGVSSRCWNARYSGDSPFETFFKTARRFSTLPWSSSIFDLAFSFSLEWYAFALALRLECTKMKDKFKLIGIEARSYEARPDTRLNCRVPMEEAGYRVVCTRLKNFTSVLWEQRNGVTTKTIHTSLTNKNWKSKLWSAPS